MVMSVQSVFTCSNSGDTYYKDNDVSTGKPWSAGVLADTCYTGHVVFQHSFIGMLKSLSLPTVRVQATDCLGPASL